MGCWLHECGFNTWVSKALTLVQKYGIDIDMGSGANLNRYCKSHIYNHFKIAWREEVQNIDKNPIFRNYKTYKPEFGMEPYLYLISNPRYRNALTILRTRSHTLEIERGRYINLLYISQKWSDCHETKSKHIDWTLGFKYDHHFDLGHDPDLEFSRSNIEYAISQPKMVRLPRNKKQIYRLNSRPIFCICIILRWINHVWVWVWVWVCDQRVWPWP